MLRILLFVTGLLFLYPVATAAPIPAPKADEPVPLTTAKLLKYRKLQKELKMTAEQRINLFDALEDIEEEYEKRILALDKLPNAPEEAFEKAEKDRLTAIEKVMTTTAEKALTPAQRTRLRQVGLQVQGPTAFTEPIVQKSLQLDDDAKKSATALAELAKEKAELYLNQLGEEDEDKVKMEVLEWRKESAKDFAKRLTPAQQDAWKAMLGEPVKSFDVGEFWLRVIEDEDLEN